MMTSAPTPTYPSPEAGMGVGADVEDDTAALRVANNAKRPLPFSGPAPAADTCKKRRKQSTPIRISTTGTADVSLDIGLCYEGKLGHGPTFPSPSPDPDPELEPDPGPSHIKVEHSPSPAEPTSPSLPVNLSGGQNFPPWLSDVQVHAKTNDWLNASTQAIANHNFYVPVPGVGVPVTTPNSRAVTAAQSQPPIRIFNPEAYCELCNKEFCNKYFLKTHKANKHRIYTDPPTSDAVSQSLPVNVPSYTTSVFALKKTSMPALSMSEALKTTSATHSDFLGVFCDLCGKSFSNNMMLKTHRVSVHGAVDQEASGESEPGLLPVEAVYKEERDPDLDMGGVLAPVTTTTPATVPDKDSTIYKNDHFKEDSGINQLSTMDQDENSENALALSSQRERERERESLDFSANRRRLGIMNPEAFCEICCKEYCNKYFLRTHKMKRHGILIPDENSKDNQKDFKLELSISNSWYQIQTSPLNLIMGEQNTNSSGSCSERKSSPANENECEICGMRFQTLYLAQLHYATAHSQNRPTNNSSDEFVAALSANNNDKQAPDSISEDLQKLQTMILQLNDLDVSKVAVGTSGSALCACSMCGKEFENRYYLHAHLMTEHGVLLENNSHITDKQFEMDNGTEITPDVLQQGVDNQSLSKIPIPSSSTLSTPTPTPTPTSLPALTISSGVLDKKDDSNGFMSAEKMRANTNGTSNSNSVGSERRSSVTMTPTNSYCEICNKELCNKYFMKTHMQRMHGIEIENGAQIGGVVCNICNKELCSKYFLRVHKHNTHGIVQDNIGVGGSQPRPSNMDLEQQSVGVGVGVGAVTGPSPTTAPDMSTPGVSDPSLKLGDLSDLSNRYFTHFTEVCTICSRRFRSTKWLKAHLLGDHGKAGTEKWNELELQLQQSFGQQQQTQQRKSASVGDRASPTLRIPNGGQDNTKPEGGMQNVLSSIFGTDETNVKQYHCSFCSFSTPVLAFLFVHERSHSHTRSVVGVGMNDAPAAANNTSSSANATSLSPSAVSPLYCAVCNQSFRQPEQLHHHIVSQHTFLSLSSFFGNVRQPPAAEIKQPADASPPPLAPAPAPAPAPAADTPNANTTVEPPLLGEHKCTKCTQCGSGRDVSITLKDVSKQRQLPATYALPQPQHQLKTKYMMQAFLMDEPSDAGVTGTDVLNAGGTGTVPVNKETNGDEEYHHQQQTDTGSTATSTTTDRRFAPSIVFLPVLEKLTAPLTVSFTLTPA